MPHNVLFPLTPHLRLQYKILTDIVMALNSYRLVSKHGEHLPSELSQTEIEELEKLWENEGYQKTLNGILQEMTYLKLVATDSLVEGLVNKHPSKRNINSNTLNFEIDHFQKNWEDIISNLKATLITIDNILVYKSIIQKQQVEVNNSSPSIVELLELKTNLIKFTNDFYKVIELFSIHEKTLRKGKIPDELKHLDNNA